MKNLLPSRFLVLIFFQFLFHLILSAAPVQLPQNNQFGWFTVQFPSGWSFDATNSNGEYYTFNFTQNNKTGYVLHLQKEPVDCPEQKHFNLQITKAVNDLYSKQNYAEKLKIKSDYNVLGDPHCYFAGFTVFQTKEKSFLLLPYSNRKSYKIYIVDKIGKTMDLRPELLEFLAGLNANEQPANAITENLAENPSANSKPSTSSTAQENNKAITQNTKSPGEGKSTNTQIKGTSHSETNEYNVSEKEIMLTRQNLKFDRFNFDIDFDFETFTKMQYAGAVSLAMEGMRLVYGEMPPEQETKFEKEWKPLFQFPYPEAIEYLNKLNPLLAKFTAIREVLSEEMENYNAGVMDVTVAAACDDNEQIQQAMAGLEVTVAAMNTLTKQLEEVTNEIVKLGNPPNVGEMASGKKKIHKNALDLISGPSLPFEGEWVNEKGEHTLIKHAYTYPDGKLLLYIFPVTWLKNMENKGYDVLNDPGLKDDKNLGGMPGTWDFLKVFEPISENCFAALDWSFVRQVNAYTFSHSKASLVVYTPPQSDLIQSGTQKFTLNKTEETYPVIPVLPYDDGIENWEDLVKAIPTDEWAKKKYDGYIEWRIKYPEEIATAIGGGPTKEQQRIVEYEQKKRKIDEQYSNREADLKAAEAAVEVELAWSSEKVSEKEKADRIAKRKAEINYDYENRYDKLNAEYADVLGGPKQSEKKPEISGELVDYIVALKEWETEKALQKQKEEQIKFHETNISYFQKNIESLQSKMNQAGTAPESKNSMYRDLLVQQNSLQREKDAIQSIKTGEYVHTRTEHDAFNMQISMANSIQKAEEVHQVKRALERIPLLIEMAPETDRERLTQFFRNNTNSDGDIPLDASRVFKVAKNIGDQVTGRLEQEASREEEAAALATAKLEAVQYVKAGADAGMTLLSVAAPVYYAYSAPNAVALSMRAAKAARVFSMYTGTTGYIEGGLTQAFTQTLGSYNAATMVANAAIAGYQKGVLNHLEEHAQNAGKMELNETNAGLRGAAWEAGKESAKFIVQGMALRYIVPQPPAKLNAQFTDIANARNTASLSQPSKWPTIQQQIQQAHFQSRQADGRAKVKLFQESVQKVANAAKSGATQAEIQQLRTEMEYRYATVKGDYFAKADLNQRARQGDTKTLHYYNSCERKFIAQLTSVVDRRMSEAGYSKQTYKTFSNSASKGKAGMDLDFGVVEPPRYTLNAQGRKIINPAHVEWRKNITQKLPDGTVVRRSPNDLQAAGKEALEAAYQEVYGRPSGEAMIEFTSSYHPEAYRDLAWLGRKGTKTALVFETDPVWVQQAADVSMFKVNHLPKDHPNLGYYGQLQEQMRGLTKDFDTKIEPLIKANPKANSQAVNHLRELRTTMDRFAKNEIGPVEADNKIKELTGGRGIKEVAEQLSVAMQTLRNMIK